MGKLKLHLVTLFSILTIGVLSIGNVAPAYAATPPIVTTTHKTTTLTVDCKKVPTSSKAIQVMKNHRLCGYSNPGIQPDSTISGNCGTLTNNITNLGNGEALVSIDITSFFYLGPIVTAAYSGSFWNYTQDFGETVAGGGLNSGFFTYHDQKVEITETGYVAYYVLYAQDITAFGISCSAAGQVNAATTVN